MKLILELFSAACHVCLQKLYPKITDGMNVLSFVKHSFANKFFTGSFLTKTFCKLAFSSTCATISLNLCKSILILNQAKQNKKGWATALVRSHMNVSLVFERTIEQTTRTMPPLPQKNSNCYTRGPVELRELLHH